MEIEVKVKRVEAVKEVGQNNFKTRNIICETEEQYPQVLSLQFVQDKIELLNDLKAGDKVKVSIALRDREITKEDGTQVVYNTIQGWKVQKM